jgi:hypothetical protein
MYSSHLTTLLITLSCKLLHVQVVEPSSVAAAYAAAMSSSDTPAAEAAGEGEEGQELQPGEALNESISFLAPAIGSYYFTFSALDCVAAFYDANPLSMYRMAPVGKLPSKAPPPAMSVNLPPNATQAQRMQASRLFDLNLLKFCCGDCCRCMIGFVCHVIKQSFVARCCFPQALSIGILCKSSLLYLARLGLTQMRHAELLISKTSFLAPFLNCVTLLHVLFINFSICSLTSWTGRSLLFIKRSCTLFARPNLSLNRVVPCCTVAFCRLSRH